MQVEDLVTISDDDDEPTLVSHAVARFKKCSKSTSSSSCIYSTSATSTGTIETANGCSSATDDCIVVESSRKDEEFGCDEFQKKITKPEIDKAVAKIKKKNECLAMFVSACLNFEDNRGMLRIITRTLLKCYNEADKTYTASNNFHRVITKAIYCIKTNPSKKYSHIKNLCDTLSSKREYNLSENNNIVALGKRKGTLESNGRIKRYKTDSIVVDSEEDSDVIIEDVIDLEEARNSKQKSSVRSHSDADKENIASDDAMAESDRNIHIIEGKSAENDVNSAENVDNVLAETDRNFLKHNGHLIEKDSITAEKLDDVLAESDGSYPKKYGNFTEKENNSAEKLAINDENSEDMLLTPNLEEVVPLSPSACNSEDLNSMQFSEEIDNEEPQFSEEVRIKIVHLEQQILGQKLLVEQLEQQEVDLDKDYSPYIRCEKAKELIVKLYKELCELTGTQSVKKKKVTLQVLEGHPPGPTKKLEDFINSNIGDNGLPPFPDFCDVVKCVLKASAEDGLGWQKAQVLKEASALFTQCGTALQQRRMQREYRDLISLERAGQPAAGGDDGDPANTDPELMRKLQQNRRIAVKNECEILERYSMMQCLPPQPKPAPTTSSLIGIVHPTSSHVNLGQNNSSLTFQHSKNNQCMPKHVTPVNHRRINPILHVPEKQNGSLPENMSHHTMIERQVKCNKGLLRNPFAQVRLKKLQNVEDSVKSPNCRPISMGTLDISKTVKLDLNNSIVLVNQTDCAGHSVEHNKHSSRLVEHNKHLSHSVEHNKHLSHLVEHNKHSSHSVEHNKHWSHLVERNKSDLMEIDELDSNNDGKGDADSGNDSHSDYDDEQDVIYNLVSMEDVSSHKSLTSLNGINTTDVVDLEHDSYWYHNNERDVTYKLISTENFTNHKRLTSINGTNRAKEANIDSSNTNTETNNDINPTTNISVTPNTSTDLNMANNSNTVNESGINSDVNESVGVKKEKKDIYQLLEELGDDFTSTIIEIEDPFLVIEISSDSEDE